MKTLSLRLLVYGGLCSLIAVAVLAEQACADHCAPPIRYAAPVVQHQVQQYHHGYQAQQYALAIFVPTPSYTVGISAERIEKLLELRTEKAKQTEPDKLDLILQRLEALEQGNRPQPLTAPTPPAPAPTDAHAPKVLTDSCVSCHSGPRPKAALDLSKPTPEGKALAVGKVAQGLTCKGAKALTEAQRKELIGALVR